jgi:hypothetical protein
MYAKFLSENLEGKIPLGSCLCRWERNTKVDLNEIGCEDVDWINLAQGGSSGGLL